MNQQEVRQYLERYFDAHQTQYVEKTPDYFSVQLPVEVDKDLGNRPFYWTYVERLNLEPQPMFMTFIFHPESVPPDLRGEKITFGSPRLQQFFTSARRHGQYIRLYEHTPILNEVITGNTPLIPWLGINLRISMICDGKKDHLMSLGFNLVNGSIVESFSDHLTDKDMKPVMPDLSFTIPPIFSLDSAIGKLEEHIQGFLQSQDPTWADEARKRLDFETSLVENFYTQEIEEEEGETSQENVKEKRVEELHWQFAPRIEVEIINGGLFYFRTPH